MEYEIKLQEFEGPLDLLLHLIKKNEVDIFDIPISQITDQYILYINQLKEYDMELTSEFVLMAAQLIQIKSKLLLPPDEDQEGEEIDPREELAQKIYEYKIFKEISQYMKEREENYLKIYFKDPEYHHDVEKVVTPISIIELMNAYKKVLAINKLYVDDKASPHKIEREAIKVEDKVKEILHRLKGKSKLKFSSLFTFPTSRTNIVTTLLALLELIKGNLISFQQYSVCDEIIITKV